MSGGPRNIHTHPHQLSWASMTPGFVPHQTRLLYAFTTKPMLGCVRRERRGLQDTGTGGSVRRRFLHDLHKITISWEYRNATYPTSAWPSWITMSGGKLYVTFSPAFQQTMMVAAI